MPESQTLARAHRDAEEGKAPSTQAGEFVREEIEHVRQGKHGVRSTKQAIAIGLSKARRAGVKLPPPKRSSSSESARKKARQDEAAARHPHKRSAKRARPREHLSARAGSPPHRRRSRARRIRQLRAGPKPIDPRLQKKPRGRASVAEPTAPQDGSHADEQLSSNHRDRNAQGKPA